jgi:predicted Zn-dependent protease
MKKFLFIVAVLGVGWWYTHRGGGGCGTSGAVECPSAELEEGVGVTLAASDVCPTAGYLCYQRTSFQVMRWPLDKGKLKIHVPRPDFLNGEAWETLRDAVTDGFREWDGHPFPLVIDTGKLAPGSDITVSWVQSEADSGQVGHARVNVMPEGKRLRYSVSGLTIAVMAELSPAALDRIRATASHELGHALGLQHSDAARDLMYREYPRGGGRVVPTARDFQTVEALYALPNGARIQ